MIYILILVLNAFAAPGGFAEKAVNGALPESVMVKFDPQQAPIDGTLVTFITGAGHFPGGLNLTTFRWDKDKVTVFQSAWGAHDFAFKDPKTEKYPYSTLDYQIKTGEMPVAEFKKMTAELSKIHFMKTFKEYEIYDANPVPFEGAYTDGIGIGGKTSYMNTVDFAVVINLWKAKDMGFNYGFSGYGGNDTDQKAIKVRAMATVIEGFLREVKLTEKKDLLPEYKDFFHHQFEVAGTHYNGDFWWWVKERSIGLASALGTDKDVANILLALKDKPDKEKKASNERIKYIAATALAQITGKDYRFDKQGKPLPITKTEALYVKEFKHKIKEKYPTWINKGS